MADSSFDIVSKIDHQEVANALNSAAREVATRYDFKNVGASIEASGEDKVIDQGQHRGAGQRRPRRLPDLAGQAQGLAQAPRRPRAPARSSPARSTASSSALKEGISQENAKKIGKIIRDEGPKSVKAQIQGDELRVTSKSRDDLQAVQALLKGKDDLDFAIQFTNYS